MGISNYTQSILLETVGYMALPKADACEFVQHYKGTLTTLTSKDHHVPCRHCDMAIWYRQAIQECIGGIRNNTWIFRHAISERPIPPSIHITTVVAFCASMTAPLYIQMPISIFERTISHGLLSDSSTCSNVKKFWSGTNEKCLLRRQTIIVQWKLPFWWLHLRFQTL